MQSFLHFHIEDFMVVEQYLQNILFQKQAIFIPKNCYTDDDYEKLIKFQPIKNIIKDIIKAWGGEDLDEVFFAGSLAKGTAIRGKSDCDIFISIKHSCAIPMKDLFYSLLEWLRESHKFQEVRKQNVSIGIKLNGYNVDLVPGKRQLGNTNYHCIYKSKQDSWMQTNVKMQAEYIHDSKRTNHIKLAKIWRDCHRLNFPSVNIELAVLDALKHKKWDISLSDGFEIILKYFAENLRSARLVDVSNSKNIISDDMTAEEKSRVAECADRCLRESWSKIIW